MLESPECEEEEYKILAKDDLIRKEKRDKLIRSCSSYVYLRETPKLFTKEERETLCDQ
jgi:hypothetical protein